MMLMRNDYANEDGEFYASCEVRGKCHSVNSTGILEEKITPIVTNRSVTMVSTGSAAIKSTCNSKFLVKKFQEKAK